MQTADRSVGWQGSRRGNGHSPLDWQIQVDLLVGRIGTPSLTCRKIVRQVTDERGSHAGVVFVRLRGTVSRSAVRTPRAHRPVCIPVICMMNHR